MNATPWAEVPGIGAYIPQYRLPLLDEIYSACDPSTFNQSHVTWQKPQNSATGEAPMDHGNLFLDAAPVVKELKLTHPIFSTCKQYIPDRQSGERAVNAAIAAFNKGADGKGGGHNAAGETSERKGDEWAVDGPTRKIMV